MAFILNSFFQESDLSQRAAADAQMKEMSGKDIDHLVKELETLPNDANFDQLKSLYNLNNFELLEDYEYDKNVTDQGLRIIRRKMHALFRQRFKKIMKLRREVKARESAGHYTTRAKKDVLNSTFLPESITPAVKRLTILCLFDIFYISIVSLFSPTAAMNSVMNGITRNLSGLWLVYWLPTILYGLTILVAFSLGRRIVHIISVSMGFGSFLWHVTALILFMTDEFEYPSALGEKKASNFHAILWYIELAMAFLILLTHVRITTASGGYIKLDLDMIDTFEMREFPYLLSQRHLEQTANVQRQVYNAQLRQINRQI